MILAEVSATGVSKGKESTQRTRSWSLTAPVTLPNEQDVAALPWLQHILDANRLTWSDVGHHPDCQFASFIHASQEEEATWDLIIGTPRKCRPHFQGDFVRNLYQSGALKFVHQLYLSGDRRPSPCFIRL